MFVSNVNEIQSTFGQWETIMDLSKESDFFDIVWKKKFGIIIYSIETIYIYIIL